MMAEFLLDSKICCELESCKSAHISVYGKGFKELKEIENAISFLNLMGLNSQGGLGILQGKERLILTEWDNSAESKKNFKKAIKRLKNDNIEFIVVERRLITEFAKEDILFIQ